MKQNFNPKKLVAFFILQFAFFTAFGQDCGINGNYDWQQIVVKVVDPASPLEADMISGEWQVEGVQAITEIPDLSESTLTTIKKQVADSKACAVYVDIYGVMNSAEGLYYYGVYE